MTRARGARPAALRMRSRRTTLPRGPRAAASVRASRRAEPSEAETRSRPVVSWRSQPHRYQQGWVVEGRGGRGRGESKEGKGGGREGGVEGRGRRAGDEGEGPGRGRGEGVGLGRSGRGKRRAGGGRKKGRDGRRRDLEEG